MDGAVETAWMARHRSVLIAAAAVAPLLCAGGLAAFRGSVIPATAALVLVLIVVAAAATGDRFAGIVAALSSGVSFDLFLTEPHGRLTITDPHDIEVTVLLVLVGAAVTEIALWGHRQQARASRRAGYLEGVLGTSKIISVPQASPDDLIDHVALQPRPVAENIPRPCYDTCSGGACSVSAYKEGEPDPTRFGRANTRMKETTANAALTARADVALWVNPTARSAAVGRPLPGIERVPKKTLPMMAIPIALPRRCMVAMTPLAAPAS